LFCVWFKDKGIPVAAVSAGGWRVFAFALWRIFEFAVGAKKDWHD